MASFLSALQCGRLRVPLRGRRQCLQTHRRFSSNSTQAAANIDRAAVLARATPSSLLSGEHSLRVETRQDWSATAPLTIVPVTEQQASQRTSFLRDVSIDLSKEANSDFEGKAGTSQLQYTGAIHAPRVMFLGLGKEEKLTRESVRDLAHAAASHLQTGKHESGRVELQHLPGLEQSELVDVFVRTFALSNDHFDKHIQLADKKKHRVSSLTLVTESEAQAAAERAALLSSCTVLARELANERADIATVQYMQDIALGIGEAHGLKSLVVSQSELTERGLHLLAAVGQGSQAQHSPRLVVLEHKGNPESSDWTALIGKGIVFDTGGLNLKPTGFMETMHMDMGGAAAVLGAMKAVAALNLPVNIVCCVALAENSIGSRSYKPGAIIPSPKGSIEVGNTDAEGRLALADAFSYVQSEYKPQTLIDVATLTGACVVGLGEYLAGVFSNNDDLSRSLVDSGRWVHERCWPLPIEKEHEEELKTDQADFSSTGKGRYGGASTAAAFLKIFVDEGVHWAHMDIAGPGMYSSARKHMYKGGTGFGVQVLVEHLERQAAGR